jgi:hypothetical protein
MSYPQHLVAEAAMVYQRSAEWLRGDVIRVFAVAWSMPGRYKVRGLDKDGFPKTDWREDLAAGLVVASVFNAVVPSDDNGADGGPRGPVVVGGEDPDCVAVSFRRALRQSKPEAGGHAFLVITSHRVAVLRLRDTQEDAAPEPGAEERPTVEGSPLERLRGMGRLVKKELADIRRRASRPPLSERPGDAALDCPFELPLAALRGHELDRQGRVRLSFSDGSWTLIRTDPAGQTALAGPA